MVQGYAPSIPPSPRCTHLGPSQSCGRFFRLTFSIGVSKQNRNFKGPQSKKNCTNYPPDPQTK